MKGFISFVVALVICLIVSDASAQQINVQSRAGVFGRRSTSVQIGGGQQFVARPQQIVVQQQRFVQPRQQIVVQQQRFAHPQQIQVQQFSVPNCGPGGCNNVQQFRVFGF